MYTSLKHKYLIFFNINKQKINKNVHRNNQGKTTTLTTGTRRCNQKVLLNIYQRTYYVGLLVGFFFYKKKNKLFFICIDYNKKTHIFIGILGIFLGTFIFLNTLNTQPQLGSSFFLKHSNLFFMFSLIKKTKTTKPIFSVAAGTMCSLYEKHYNLQTLIIILPSNALKLLHTSANATLGRVFTELLVYKNKKAGNLLFLGKRPVVRGVAKNPVDHPNGGRTKAFQHELSVWGWTAKHKK